MEKDCVKTCENADTFTCFACKDEMAYKPIKGTNIAALCSCPSAIFKNKDKDKGVVITVGKVNYISVLNCCKNIFKKICNERNKSGGSLLIKEAGGLNGYTIYQYELSEKNKEIALYNVKEAYEIYINK